jgi:uncharacterized protein (TIGR02646 family)
MRRINKGIEPASLSSFKNTFPSARYENFADGYENVRIDVRSSCLLEQHYLCAYCCDRITLRDSHNDHIVPQSSLLGQNLTLDYSNIVASCNAKKHCGRRKDDSIISITPLMPNCETDIIYQLNGKMTHKSQNAQNTITTLNLRDGGLTHKRKILIDTVLYKYTDDISELALEESFYLELIINEITQVNEEGKLEAFTPVIVNVLSQFLS